MRQSRSRRLARGAAAASVATFAALVSHVSAGATMPTWLGLIVPAIFSLMVCTLLTGRRLSLTRLSIGVLLSQGLFHALFVLGASDVVMTSTPGHDHAAMLAKQSLAMSTSDAAALYGNATMWLGHVAAAGVTIAALYRGEQTLRTAAALARDVVSWLRRKIRLVSAFQPALPAAAEAPLVIVVVAPRLRLNLRHLPRRGPPLFVSV